jgi:hypothetical protein
MTALAGAQTAGAFPYNVTPEHTARARAIIGPEKWLCVEQKGHCQVGSSLRIRGNRPDIGRRRGLLHDADKAEGLD